MASSYLRETLRSEKWWRLVALVREEMLYGPKITASKPLMDFEILSPGDLVEVDGEWHAIKRVLGPTLVLVDGRPVKKTDLPDPVAYRHKDDGALMTGMLMVGIGSCAFALAGVAVALIGVIVAVVAMAGNGALTGGAICLAAAVIWWVGFGR